MAITYTEEQRELVKLVRDVARNEVMPHVAAADKAGECPRELYQWGFDLGLHMVEIPEQFGGMGLSYETCAMMFEELAWVDAAYADTFVTNFVAFRNILLNGTEEQARHFVEKTENNGFAAFCLTEANAGSDVAAMRTTAVLDGDEYVLTAQDLHHQRLHLRHLRGVRQDRPGGRRPRHHGLPRRRRHPGSCCRRQGAQDGLPPVGHHRGRSRERARAPKRCHRGSGPGHVHRSERPEPLPGLYLHAGRGHHAASARRGRGLREAAQAVRRRLIDFEMVQQMLADMAIKTEAARVLVNNCMRQMDAGEMVRKDGAIVKTFVTDAMQEVVSNAVQVLGGYGYSEEYPVEKLMRERQESSRSSRDRSDPAHDHRQGTRPGVPIS